MKLSLCPPPPGHYNNLDYSVCVEPESGFCGIEYQQVGPQGFSLTNITEYQDDSVVPYAEVRYQARGRELRFHTREVVLGMNTVM